MLLEPHFERSLALLCVWIELPTDVRAELELVDLTRGASKIQLGPRARWGHAGKLTQPWNVVESVPREVLISPADQGRRRVVFPPERSRHVIADKFVDTSFGSKVLYRHSWNDAGRVRGARARASSTLQGQSLPQSRDEQEPAGLTGIQ